MKSFLHILQLCLFVLFLLLVQFIVSYIFPFPLNTIHVLTATGVIYLILRERRRIVWYMLGFLFLVELIVPTDVYGSLFIPGVLATFIAYWFHRFFFTNQSLYTGVLLTLITLGSFHSLRIAYIFLSHVFIYKSAEFVPLQISIFLTEVATTLGAVIAILFVLLRRKRLGS